MATSVPVEHPMRTLLLIALLLLLGCAREGAAPDKPTADTSAPAKAIGTPPAPAPSEKKLPNWYVFRIKAFNKVTYSDDKTFAIVEGVTVADKMFKVKLVWAEPFKASHPRAIDRWLKLSKAAFEAGIPYVIAGDVISRDPLAIRPDTVVANAPNFGAPAESVY